MTGEPIPGTLAGPAGGAADTESAEQPWQRLAVGMLLVEPVREIIRFIPMLVILIFAGRAGQSGPPWGLIGTGAVIALGISRWLTTRYRITPTVVEVRRGVFQRKHVTVPRDRVRTVDVSAHPLQRALRLVKVHIGTGSSHHGAQELVLDGLRADAAAPLRAQLLHRVPPAPTDSAPAEPPVTELARLDKRWVLYAPATLSGVVTAAFLIGLGWRITSEASVDPTRLGIVRGTLGYLQGTPLWVDIFQGSAAVIVVITLLSLAGYVLAFWGYRLTRHPHGTLQVSRGLLTTRSISIEERRLRGVQRSEPLLLRAVGGARLQAVATGLRHHGSDRGGSERGGALLVPPAPLTTVVAVESAVLGSAEPATATLLAHGPAARRRRFTRAVGVTLVLIAALAALSWRAHWPPQPVALSLVALPLAALLARDRYRSLGHRLLGDRLIVRVGSLVRRRTVLAVPGVIGVTIRQSMFQRRHGLVTLIATTAAGAQHYDVPDVPSATALELAAALVSESGSFTALSSAEGATEGSTAPANPVRADTLPVL